MSDTVIELPTKPKRKRRTKAKPPLSFAEYLRGPGVNFSTLKFMRRSPLHYLEAVTAQNRDSSSLIRLRAIHTALLEPEKFASTYPIYPGDRRGTKEYKEFEAANPGGCILKMDEAKEVFAIRDAVLAHRPARRYIEQSQHELSLSWKDETTKLDCKGRLDALAGDILIDLKGGVTNARVFASLVARNGYHNQAAFYRAGVRANGGDVSKCVLIVYEIKPPFDCAVFALRPEDVEVGHEENAELLMRVRDCMHANNWPGCYPDETLIDLPAWAGGTTDDETDIGDLGLEFGGGA